MRLFRLKQVESFRDAHWIPSGWDGAENSWRRPSNRNRERAGRRQRSGAARSRWPRIHWPGPGDPLKDATESADGHESEDGIDPRELWRFEPRRYSVVTPSNSASLDSASALVVRTIPSL